MRDLYSDDYESVAGDGATRLLPEGARRIAGAMVFLGLVGAMGSGPGGSAPATRPRCRSSGRWRGRPGSSRRSRAGSQAAHQGLEVNAVLAGQPAPRITPTAAQAGARGR